MSPTTSSTGRHAAARRGERRQDSGGSLGRRDVGWCCLVGDDGEEGSPVPHAPLPSGVKRWVGQGWAGQGRKWIRVSHRVGQDFYMIGGVRELFDWIGRLRPPPLPINSLHFYKLQFHL